MRKHYFGKSFFEKHQKALVWFANSRFGRSFFALAAAGVPKSEPIYEVYPNRVSFGWKLKRVSGQWKIVKKTAFFTRPRLSYQLMHAWQHVENIQFATKGVFWDLWRQPATAFFADYQGPILRLARTDFGKWFFGMVENAGMDIKQVNPNHLVFMSGGKVCYEYRTHAKFWKALRYRLKFAQVIPYLAVAATAARAGFVPAAQMFPMLALGTAVYYPDSNAEFTSVDGRSQYDNLETVWATVRNATAGTSSSDGAAEDYFCRTQLSGGSFYVIYRGFFLFDTSSLPDATTITAATISLWATTVTNTDSPDLDIVSSSPASNTAIVNADYDQVGSTVYASTAIASLSTGAYNIFTLDSNGIANITKTGVSKFGTRVSRDTDDTAPTGDNRVIGYFADQAGLTNDPKLTVTSGASRFVVDQHPETTTVDGYALRDGVDQTLSNIRSGAGTNADDSGGGPYYMDIQCSTTTNQFQGLRRGFFLFDTSSMTDTDVVSSATVLLSGANKTNGLTQEDELHIVATTPASNTTIAGSDYANVGSTSFGSVAYASWSTSAYNSFTLNASGIAAVTTTGVTKLGCRLGWDLNNSFGGTWASTARQYMAWNPVDFHPNMGPTLIVEHAAPTGPVNVKTINGITKANVKTVNGIAIANVKSLNGIT